MSHVTNEICDDSQPTLKEISVVMVKPWVMYGSSSWGRPFQQSSSTQRQPVSSTCLYISTDDRPVSWPTVGRQKTEISQNLAQTEKWREENRTKDDEEKMNLFFYFLH